jgi:hypothetical protein
MGDGDDHDSLRLDAIDDAERETMEQETARAVIVRRPRCWRTLDRGSRYVKFGCECRGGLRAACRVPAGSFFSFG